MYAGRVHARKVFDDRARTDRAVLGPRPAADRSAGRDRARRRESRSTATRFLRSGVSVADPAVAGVRAPLGRGHAADRPARGDGPADRRAPARALRAGGVVARTAAG